MAVPAKLGTPFQCLFDEAAASGLRLPEYFRQVYGGDWAIPMREGGLYTYANLVVSHDGRISFNEPGHYGGGDISSGNQHDAWLMGLLRARADAVLVGDNTPRLEPEHLWTHQYIFPDDSENFEQLRRSEGRPRYPYQVFLSLDGGINWDADVFMSPDYHVLIATTSGGAARVRADRRGAARLDIIEQEHDSVELRELANVLCRDFSVRTLLIEGGPRAYGSAIAAGIIDEEFLTISPLIVGNDTARGKARPGLYEGLAFQPGSAARMVPVSLRRNGDFLFVRSRCIYPDEIT